MEGKLSRVAQTLKPSPIQELSLLAQRCDAINLAEGFPDFPAPPRIKEAAISAISSDFNQYRHVQGICDCLAKLMKQNHGLDIDPLTDVAICCGQTEAFAAAIFATINQGDEVLLFDPAYETYETCILIAGGTPVYVPLDPPCWSLDLGNLMKAFTARTKAIVLNSPHNPTGKVFSKNELEAIARACCSMDCLAITDEVYEYVTYDMEKHSSLASLPGMQERTIITSSLSKTFSITAYYLNPKYQYDRRLGENNDLIKAVLDVFMKLFPRSSGQGEFGNELIKFRDAKGLFGNPLAIKSRKTTMPCWRIGWAIAPPVIASAIRNVHIKLTDSAPAPFQEAALTALRSPPAYFETLRTDYESKRNYIVKLLSEVGFQIDFKPQGSFFVFAELPEKSLLSDVDFIAELIKQAGVAAVPGRSFFHPQPASTPSMEPSPGCRNYQERYVRFAFCKSNATLSAAAKKMGDLVDDGMGFLKLSRVYGRGSDDELCNFFC